MSEVSASDLRKMAQRIDNLWAATTLTANATFGLCKAVEQYLANANPCPELDDLRDKLAVAKRDTGRVANLMSNGLAGSE